MTTKSKEKPAKAMAFNHSDGLTAAWQQAMMYAGEGGRIATMPDVVEARLNAKPGTQDSPWEKYYTTATAEYVGYGKDGKKLIIVAHGIGPMSNIDGIQKAYSWQFRDKNRNRRGGRITQQEFLDLEAGKFGKVEIVDFAEYIKLYKYPFIETVDSYCAGADPLLTARLGPKCAEYVTYNAEFARAWHREHAGLKRENKYAIPEDIHKEYYSQSQKLHVKSGAENSEPYIIQIKDESNCSYLYKQIEEGYALAHLISISGLVHSQHQNGESLVHEIGCHAWNDGVRLIGIQAGDSESLNIYSGPDPHQLLRRHWSKLMELTPINNVLGFCRIMEFDNHVFTQYQKTGDSLDTCEPEYLVKSAEKIGEPMLFRTEITGYYGFFRYNISEMKALALPHANAYQLIDDAQIEYQDGNPSHHTIMVQFYKIEANTAKRLIRATQLARDYNTMMRLLKKE